LSSSAIVVRVFEFVILLFSLSFHECAHAWMASRLGDQTARMQGRVTLNPIPHIDPVGTLLFPALVIFGPLLGLNLPFLRVGWAKPTPVITRNLKNIVRDDNLITLAGPLANFALALIGFIALVVVTLAIPGGRDLLRTTLQDGQITGSSTQGLVVLAVVIVEVNVSLFFFNLLPIPPLDGSHLLRNMLPYNTAKQYDRVGGWIGIILMVTVGGVLLGFLINPILDFVFTFLLAI
jgi:Zn-dependent protease